MIQRVALALGAMLFLFNAGCASSAKKYASPDEWIAESKVGQHMPLGSGVGEWSEAKNFVIPQGTVAVKSQFVKHHGATCHYNIEFKNVGTTNIDTTAGLTTQERVNIYSHNSGRVKLEPGKSVTYKDLEARECPIIFGTSTDMNACAACRNWILFTK